MSIIDMLLVGVGLSMDAFAVSVCKGLSDARLTVRRMLLIALFFGAFQALMPLIGWLLGTSVKDLIEPVGDWIAFALLVAIGAKMLYDALTDQDTPEEEVADARSGRFMVELIALSFATSIDALVAGVSFALSDINIWLAITVIGVTTFTLSLAGCQIGKRFGSRFEKPASIIGGVALIALGFKVLFEHLGFL